MCRRRPELQDGHLYRECTRVAAVEAEDDLSPYTVVRDYLHEDCGDQP